MKSRLIILIFITLIISIDISAQQKQRISVDAVFSESPVLDEWKTPGLYSPVNILDGDIKTSYAIHSIKNHRMDITIRFNKEIMIDEIRVMNGFGRNEDLFNKNNRIKKVDFEFYSEEELKKDKPVTENIVFADQREFQSIKLKTEYPVKQVKLFTPFYILKGTEYVGAVYKGSKYNDTCLTELEFYYKGEKIIISNASQLMGKYLKMVHKNLVTAFSDKKYHIYPEHGDDSMIVYKNGKIKYIQSDSLAMPPVEEIMPDMWKVKNSKLYMRISGTWILYHYIFLTNSHGRKDVILFTNPYEFVPKDHPHLIYYKRLPDDYFFDMADPVTIK